MTTVVDQEDRPHEFFTVANGGTRLRVEDAPWWLRGWLAVYRRTRRTPLLRNAVPWPFRAFRQRGLLEQVWASNPADVLKVKAYWPLAVRTKVGNCWRFVRHSDDASGTFEPRPCPRAVGWRGEVRIGEKRQVVDACTDHVEGLRNVRMIAR